MNKGRDRLNEILTAYFLLAPWLFIFFIFIVFSIGWAFYLSFTKYNLLSPPQWVGLQEYLNVLQHEDFIKHALPNTLKYVAVVVPTQTVLSLIIAFAMDQKIKGRRLFRTIFYLPSVTSSVVISLIFLWLFSPTGVINQLFRLNVNWLLDPKTALPTIMMVNIWSTIGTMMLIFLAALQDIPYALYEAAEIDGANRFQIFRHVTIPSLRPTIFFVVTMGIIGCFQVFDQIYVMTKGGPLGATTTISYLIYDWAFGGTNIRMGRAAAASFILAMMIGLVTYIQKRFIDQPEEERS